MVASRSTITGPSGSTEPGPPRPDPAPAPAAGRQHDRSLSGQRRDQPRHRRIGGDLTEQIRLRPHHRKISEAVTAQCDRYGQIEHDLARVVPRPPRSPRRQAHAQRPIQTNRRSGVHQQRPTRRGQQRLAADHYPNPSGNAGYPLPTECLSHSVSDVVANTRIPSRTGTSVLLAQVSPQTRRPIEASRPGPPCSSRSCPCPWAARS